MRRFALGVVMFSFACGLPAAPAPPPPAPTADVPHAPQFDGGPPHPVAAVPMRLPASSAFRMSVDLSAVDGAAFQAIRPIFALEIGALGVPESADILPKLGIDGTRPMSFALVGFPDDARAAIDPLLPDAARRAPGTWPRAKQVLDGARWIYLHRVLVPVTDATLFSNHLESLVGRGKRDADGVYANRHGATRVTTDGKTVAIDTVAMADGSKTREAFAELDERLRTGDDAPPLDGGQLHAVYRPSAIATIGLVSGMEMTIGAISGESIDPSQRERIAEEGLFESSQSYMLAGAMNGAYFEDVDFRMGVGAGKLDVTLRARTGPGFHAPPDAAWAESPSVVAAGTTPKLDLSRAFVDAWSLPGETKPGGFLVALKESGIVFGALTALPNVAVFAARMYENGDALLAAAKPTKLDRVGTLRAGKKNDETIVFGLLAPGATKPDAQKAQAALAATDKDLKATSILEVDHRFVVLLAENRALLPKTVTLGKRGSMIVDLMPAALFPKLPIKPGSLPDHLIGTITRDSGAVIIKLASP